jgi:hypothetical protein
MHNFSVYNFWKIVINKDVYGNWGHHIARAVPRGVENMLKNDISSTSKIGYRSLVQFSVRDTLYF